MDKVPSSIPSCFAGWAPFFSRSAGEDVIDVIHSGPVNLHLFTIAAYQAA